MKVGARWNAVVIGAGPAGALAARQLARAGHSTLLVEKKAFPRDKVCGACVNQRAASILQAAGLTDVLEACGAIALDRWEIVAAGKVLPLELSLGHAVSRRRFDAKLVGRAVRDGVAFLDETSASVGSVSADGSYRDVVLQSRTGSGRIVAADVVLVADGLQHASLARAGDFASEVSSGSYVGLGASVNDASLPPGTVRMVVGRQGYVGLVRTERGCLNVAAAVAPQFLRECGTPIEAVAALLREAGMEVGPMWRCADWKGTALLSRQTRRIADHRLFVLGDATGYVEPFTGEGIAWALCSALLVTPLASACIASSSNPAELSERWAALHEREVRRRQRWCRGVAWLLRHPFAVRMAQAALGFAPAMVRPIAARVNAPFEMPAGL